MVFILPRAESTVLQSITLPFLKSCISIFCSTSPRSDIKNLRADVLQTPSTVVDLPAKRRDNEAFWTSPFLFRLFDERDLEPIPHMQKRHTNLLIFEQHLPQLRLIGLLIIGPTPGTFPYCPIIQCHGLASSHKSSSHHPFSTFWMLHPNKTRKMLGSRIAVLGLKRRKG